MYVCDCCLMPLHLEFVSSKTKIKIFGDYIGREELWTRLNSSLIGEYRVRWPISSPLPLSLSLSLAVVQVLMTFSSFPSCLLYIHLYIHIALNRTYYLLGNRVLVFFLWPTLNGLCVNFRLGLLYILVVQLPLLFRCAQCEYVSKMLFYTS